MKVPSKTPSQTIGPRDAGQRLDRYLKQVCRGVPFVGLQKAIRTGLVKVNGRKAPMDLRLQARDVVTLPPDFLGAPTPATAAYTPTKAELMALKASIIYEDGQILVLNKPQGLPAQAGGGQVKSLDRLLTALYGAAHAPKLVHRLDRETTGLILCGKSRTAAAALSAQWASRAVIKGYLALVLALQLPSQGNISNPIGKRGPLAVIDAEGGDPAHTHYVNLGQLEPGVFAVLAFPLTGRMNQIRVHFAHAGWPLVGDDKYGDFTLTKPAGKRLGTGLALHAWQLKVAHPHSGQPLTLTAPLPLAWQVLLTNHPNLLAAATTAWHLHTQHKG
jgi:23S rRNA pseudouridine955/2504/2580 synthase